MRTDGFEVLVQLVMAAMTTAPWPMVAMAASDSVVAAPVGASLGWSASGSDLWADSSAPTAACAPPSPSSRPSALGAVGASCLASITLSASSKDFFASARRTRSCGRVGPARLGSTVARSSSRTSEYSACAESLVCHMPCALAYASTRASVSSERPVNFR